MRKTCTSRFKSVPLDAPVTGPEELVQLKVVIALLISPINFSDCTKEWEHNRRNVLTLHRLNSLSHIVLAVCMLSVYFNRSSQRPNTYTLASDFSWAAFVFCFSLQLEDSQFFSYQQPARDDCYNVQNSLFICWFNSFIVQYHDKMIT